MRTQFYGVLAILTLCAARPTSERAALSLRLFEDLSGHIFVTREITVDTDGTVTEEKYNFLRGGAPHQKRKVGVIKVSDLPAISDALNSSRFDTLPERIPRSGLIYPDAPFRQITIERDGRKQTTTWEPLGDKAEDPEVARFNRAWDDILRTLHMPQFRMPESRPCRPGE
jgi:hypothetical protein